MAAEVKKEIELEIAHVLFIDIVGCKEVFMIYFFFFVFSFC